MSTDIVDIKLDASPYLLGTNTRNQGFHDLDLTTYDLQIVSGIDRVRQLLAVRIWFFLREWKFDKSKGIDWYAVLGDKYKAGDLEVMVKDTILGTDDVTRIAKYIQTFDNSIRKVSIHFSVDTTFGPLEMTVV